MRLICKFESSYFPPRTRSNNDCFHKVVLAFKTCVISLSGFMLYNMLIMSTLNLTTVL